MDFLIKTCQLWFKKVPVPDSCIADPSSGNEESQLFVWIAQTAQLIRDYTGSSVREVLTLAVLHVWPLLYDQVLPTSHTWWKNGGSEFYYRLEI